MFVLAPWPRTRRWVASAGRTSRAETSPFSGVARNLSSLVSGGMFGAPRRRQRLGEAEADAVGLLREEDAVGLAVVFLLVDDPRLDPLCVQLAPQGVHVADGEPAARLLRVPAVDRQADLHVVPLQPGGRPILRDQREAEALRVVSDRRADLFHRQGVRVRVADRADGLEEHTLRHGKTPHEGVSAPASIRAHGSMPAFWRVAREATFDALQRAAGIRP